MLAARWKVRAGVRLADRYLHRVRYPTRSLELKVTLPPALATEIALFHPAEDLPTPNAARFVEKFQEDGFARVVANGVFPFWAIEISWKPRLGLNPRSAP